MSSFLTNFKPTQIQLSWKYSLGVATHWSANAFCNLCIPLPALDGKHSPPPPVASKKAQSSCTADDCSSTSTTDTINFPLASPKLRTYLPFDAKYLQLVRSSLTSNRRAEIPNYYMFHLEDIDSTVVDDCVMNAMQHMRTHLFGKFTEIEFRHIGLYAYVLLRQVVAYRRRRIEVTALYRILCIAFMIAGKLLDDECLDNQCWMPLIGANIRFINQLESHFLKLCRFDIFVHHESLMKVNACLYTS